MDRIVTMSRAEASGDQRNIAAKVLHILTDTYICLLVWVNNELISLKDSLDHQFGYANIYYTFGNDK